MELTPYLGDWMPNTQARTSVAQSAARTRVLRLSGAPTAETAVARGWQEQARPGPEDGSSVFTLGQCQGRPLREGAIQAEVGSREASPVGVREESPEAGTGHEAGTRPCAPGAGGRPCVRGIPTHLAG